MRFESVTAISFGMLQDRCLEFAPNLNIIHGNNEAGKSTWHAAIYASLCGRRRGRGRVGDDDLTRYQPWGDSKWELRAVICRANGHRVEFSQELIKRTDCKARDMDLGRDLSHELIHDGSVDGSRWLGLNRKTFRAIACVQQAQILNVLQNAEALQEDLQRAAATGGGDETAAKALSTIEEYRRIHVGQNRANSTRPLRTAIERRDRAEANRNVAIAKHKEFQELSAEGYQLREDQKHKNSALRLAKAAAKRGEAKQAVRRYNRAKELAANFVGGPPSKRADDESLAQEVTKAIQSWNERPTPTELSGESSEELQLELSRLPQVPAGDLDPAIEIEMAKDTFDLALARFDEHRQKPISQPSDLHKDRPDPKELHTLAEILERDEPAIDYSLSGKRNQLEEKLNSFRQRTTAWPGVVGAVASLAGLSLSVGFFLHASSVLLGIGLITLLAGGSIFGFWLRRRIPAATLDNLYQQLRSFEKQLGEQDYRAQEYANQRGKAEQRLAELCLPADSARLVGLAQEVESAIAQKTEYERWLVEDQKLCKRYEAAHQALLEELVRRGLNDIEDVQKSVEKYYVDCRNRRKLSVEAARRHDLEHRLASRQKLEQQSKESLEKRTVIENRVKNIALQLQLSGSEPAKSVQQLDQWLEERAEKLKSHRRQIEQYAELESLLDGSSLDELKVTTQGLVDDYESHAKDLSKQEIKEFSFGDESRMSLVRRLQVECDQASQAADQVDGRIRERRTTLPDVSLADEELQSAREELERVRQLETVLDLTHEYLAKAQDRVHRDIAPKLREYVQIWLPRITGGRYTRARVDPQSLQLDVQDAAGYWRDAEELSHGTAEQIYLLLRAAISEHVVTTKGESCPFLLDDVTVQSDAVRTIEIMNWLKEISRDRQVFVFSQEDEVKEWAMNNLDEPEDRFVDLNSRD